jgi:hypothetical protein
MRAEMEAAMEAAVEETLEQLQRRLIAEFLNKKPEEITDELIDELVESEVYASARLNLSSEYGGYDNSHLEVLTRRELTQRLEALVCAREALRRESSK